MAMSAMGGHIDALVGLGANVDVKDQDGDTALGVASAWVAARKLARKGHSDVVTFLAAQ